MKVEILFPELCAIFGDYGNIIFLEENLNKEMITKTSIINKPKFVDNQIDLIYMGAMSEKTQLIVLEKLKPYVEILKSKIDDGMKVLFTGNAMDLLGRYIIEEDGTKVAGLNLFEFETVIKRSPRFNDTILGKDATGLEIIGHKTQFTQSFRENESNYFLKVDIGTGINKASKFEGFVYKDLIGTNLTGPLLPLNPDFAKKYLNVEISHYEILMRAKNQKIKDIKQYHK